MSTCNFYDQAPDFDLYTIDDEGAEFIEPCELEAAGRALQFFKIKLRPGYYEGAQLFIEESSEYGRPDWYDCNTCRAVWDLPRWKAVRAYNAEKRRINRRIVPALARAFGFERLRTVGRFSNGEAIYERA